MPITGSSVPRYQAQPTNQNGRRRRQKAATVVAAATNHGEHGTGFHHGTAAQKYG